MHPRRPVPEPLGRLAREQAGMVSREQALALGLGLSPQKRLLREGVWRHVAAGTYYTAAADPPWLALAWAGVLIGGDRARIGGHAAAHLHGLSDQPDGPITILVPWGGPAPRPRQPSQQTWEFRRERPGARLPRTVGHPPRLCVEDTVLDLACAPETDAATTIHWVTAAVQARLTTPRRLRDAAAARQFLGQRRLLVGLLTDVEGGARSVLEVGYLRKVERAHGLPVGKRQQRRLRTEVDVLYDEFGVLVELDGRLGHTGAGRFRDMRRDNAATTDGLATLRYGYGDVFDRPCEVARQVAENLIRRGWNQVPSRCDNCRRAA